MKHFRFPGFQFSGAVVPAEILQRSGAPVTGVGRNPGVDIWAGQKNATLWAHSGRLSEFPAGTLTSPPGAARGAQAAPGKCDGIGPTQVPV